MKNKTFKIYTLGCKVNQYDSLNLKSILLHQGLEYQEEGANLVIINTCAVTKTAISKDKRILNKAQKENPEAKIVLMGCWPQVYNLPKEIKERINLTWGVGKLEELTKEIFKLLNLEKKENTKTQNLVETDKSRYFLKVGDGCNQFCSYCIIPYTRGRLYSRDKKELIKEAENAITHGYKEIVLTGIHLGLYGQDKEGESLSNLLQELIEIEGLGRIRLSSIEINEITEDIIKLLKNSSKICPHFHISLQSGSDKILKLMNRPYTTKYFKEQVARIREILNNPSITTDIIVGFPGETEQDFQDTCNFCKELGFSKIHVFPFSLHEKTQAASLEGKLDKKTISQRSKQLRELSDYLESTYKTGLKGSSLEIVIQKKLREKAIGKSQYHFSTEISKNNIKEKGIGDIVTGKF